MIHSFDYSQEKIGDIGTVVATRNYVVNVEGLREAKINEGISFETGEHGYVLRLDSQYTWVVILSGTTVALGTKAARTGEKLKISCGNELVGNIVSPLGYVEDGEKTESKESDLLELDREPLGIDKRAVIKKPLYTGVTTVDLTLPLGAGQRELIIGERKTGKTIFALQTLAHQVKLGKKGVYCAIGKQVSDIVAAKEWFQKHKVYDQIVIVATSGRDNPAEIVMAPFTAMTLAESMRDNGNDVVVVLDDLTTHAKYYREMSLLIGKFPGRDSYPGDIFYIQSKILERAGCFNVDGHVRTISCLPIAESVGGDITGYIQTNLMSITDGHIFFDVENFLRGDRPAINIFLSVTRIGRQTRNKLQQNISGVIFSDLKKLGDAQTYSKFGTEGTEELNKILAKGANLKKLLNQNNFRRFKIWQMLFLFACYWRTYEQKHTPEELLNRLKETKKVLSWKKLITQTDKIDDLLSFADKIL